MTVTFLVTLYSVFAAIYGEAGKSLQWWRAPARNVAHLASALFDSRRPDLSVGQQSFRVQFVYEVTSRSMQPISRSRPGGWAGWFLLFWSWLMSLSIACYSRKWDRDRESCHGHRGCMHHNGVLYRLNVFFENPFAQLYKRQRG